MKGMKHRGEASGSGVCFVERATAASAVFRRIRHGVDACKPSTGAAREYRPIERRLMKVALGKPFRAAAPWQRQTFAQRK